MDAMDHSRQLFLLQQSQDDDQRKSMRFAFAGVSRECRSVDYIPARAFNRL